MIESAELLANTDLLIGYYARQGSLLPSRSEMLTIANDAHR